MSNFTSELIIPSMFQGLNGNIGGFNNLSLSSSTSALEFIFQALSTDPITHIGFRLNSITGTTPNYIASIQGVNDSAAYGIPDGTIKSGGSPASVVFSPSALGMSAASFNWVALDNTYTPSVGEFLSAVIAYDSGTVNVSNFASVSESIGSRNLNFCALPRVIVNNSGARTHRASPFSGGWRTANHRFGSFAFTSLSSASPSTSLEIGLKFTLPAWIGTCKFYGLQFNWAYGGVPSGGIELAVYAGSGASDTTQLTTQQHSRYATSNNAVLNMMFASPVTLSGGETYRVTTRMIAGSGGTVATGNVSDVDDWQVHPSAQWQMCYTSRSGGDWTDVATRRPEMNLMLGSVTAPSGGGSGIQIARGMHGGMR